MLNRIEYVMIPTDFANLLATKSSYGEKIEYCLFLHGCNIFTIMNIAQVQGQQSWNFFKYNFSNHVPYTGDSNLNVFTSLIQINIKVFIGNFCF